MSERNKETKNNTELSKCLDFDAFLMYVGEFGLYQKLLLLALLPFVFLWSFTYLTQIFLILLPRDYWCRIPEIESLPKAEQLALAIPKSEDGKYETCSMYYVDYTTLKALNITQANTEWPKIPCQKGWSYDREEVPYESIAMEYNWVCENHQLGTYTVVIFFLGSIVGCFCFGYIADHCGRIPALMLANLCGLIGGVISAFCKTFYTFSASRFVVGLAIDSCFTPIYILILENVGVKYRTLIANVFVALFYTPSACLLPWIAYFLNNWRILSLVTSTPIIFGLVLYFILPESPRWLLSVGRIDEGMRNIQRAADVNGAKIPEGILSDFHRCCELFYNTEQSSKNYTIFDLFKYPRMRRITIILLLIGMLVTLIYDAHVRLIVDIGSDVFITFSVANLTEFPGGLITYFVIDRVGRKPILFMVLMFCGFGSLLAALLTKNLSVTIAAIFSRLFANMGYNISLQWQAEILPTVVRAQGVALIHIMSAAATLFSPLVCYLDHYMQHLPLFILTVLSIIGAFLVLFLPETKMQSCHKLSKMAKSFGTKNFGVVHKNLKCKILTLFLKLAASTSALQH